MAGVLVAIALLGIVAVVIGIPAVRRNQMANSSAARTNPNHLESRQPEGFAHVWHMTNPPRPSLRALRERETGSLEVLPEARGAEFRSVDGNVVALTDIVSVSVATPPSSRFGRDPNNYIAVRTGDPAHPAVHYFTDGGWLGYRAILTKSNLQLLRALETCPR